MKSRMRHSDADDLARHVDDLEAFEEPLPILLQAVSPVSAPGRI
jgi:hypothetical protein